MTTVEIPSGLRHYQTTCFAETEEAFDALTSEDGWELKSYHYSVETNDTVPYTTPGARLHRSKSANIRDCFIIVLPPLAVPEVARAA